MSIVLRARAGGPSGGELELMPGASAPLPVTDRTEDFLCLSIADAAKCASPLPSVAGPNLAKLAILS